MSDQQIDEFIEHFGIKGMHWGVSSQQNLDRVNRVARGTEVRKQHRQKVAKRVAIVGGVSIAAVGAAYVFGKMHSYGKAPVSQMPKSFKAATAFTEQQLKAHRHEILSRHAALRI